MITLEGFGRVHPGMMGEGRDMSAQLALPREKAGKLIPVDFAGPFGEPSSRRKALADDRRVLRATLRPNLS